MPPKEARAPSATLNPLDKFIAEHSNNVEDNLVVAKPKPLTKSLPVLIPHPPPSFLHHKRKNGFASLKDTKREYCTVFVCRFHSPHFLFTPFKRFKCHPIQPRQARLSSPGNCHWSVHTSLGSIHPRSVQYPITVYWLSSYDCRCPACLRELPQCSRDSH